MSTAPTQPTKRWLATQDETDTKREWIALANRRRDQVRSGHMKPIPSAEVYRRIDLLRSDEAGFLSTAHTPADIEKTVQAAAKVMGRL